MLLLAITGTNPLLSVAETISMILAAKHLEWIKNPYYSYAFVCQGWLSRVCGRGGMKGEADSIEVGSCRDDLLEVRWRVSPLFLLLGFVTPNKPVGSCSSSQSHFLL